MSEKLSIVTYSLSKSYTDKSIAGGGISAGKNCVIDSITDITGGHRVSFGWYLDNGTHQTATMDVMDGSQGETGLGIKSVAVNNSNHLIVTYDDDTTEDAGEIKDVSTSFDKITDVDLSNLQDGQILKYNASTQKWENASAGTVDTDLVDLNDVDVENLTDGQIIVWDAASSRWVNADNAPSITIDPTPTSESENAVSSGGVYTALSGKVDTISGKGLSTEDYTTAEKTKLSGIETGAEVNVQSDFSQTDTDADDYIKNKPTLGTASAKNSTNSVTTGSTDLVESGAVKTAIDAAISSVYKPCGDKTVAELISSLLVAGNLGNVYNVTDSGTTTADFVGGAGKTINVGDNVAIVDVGSSTYKFDLLSGMVDLTNYVQKSQTAGLLKNDGTVDTDTFVKTSSTAGLLKNDGTVDTNTYATTSQLPGTATTLATGLVKPDGTTITIDANGVISSVGGGDEGEMLTGWLLEYQWSNYSQTVTVSGLNSSDVGAIGFLDTITPAQLAAAKDANIQLVSVSGSSVTFSCEKYPNVNIPFGVLVSGSSSSGNLPDGGTTGQVLKKKSNTDLDVEWGTVTSIPNGGTTGQVLSKHSNTDGDVEWTSPADTSKMYSTDDAAFTDIADGDYIPVYDTSATTKKKSLWSNIKSLLKTYFDTLYQKKLAYSTSEQVIGTWITGKPIYQRVYTGTLNKTTSAGTEASTEISVGASVSAFIALKGFVISDGNSYQTIPTYRYSGGQQYLRITGNTNMASSSVNKIFVNNAWYTGNASYVVIAQYTKTTD